MLSCFEVVFEMWLGYVTFFRNIGCLAQSVDHGGWTRKQTHGQRSN